jgi:apolipoprotein N-acyltransferase
MLALLNALIALAAATDRRHRLMSVAAALALLVTVSAWGALRLSDSRLAREGAPIRVALVQGNVPQDEKWDPSRAASIFDRYLRLTRVAAQEGGQFIIWPESATPFFSPARRECVSW